MQIKPVESYEPPKYAGFELKNGLKLSAGVAATAILMGMLSGCAVVEHAGGVIDTLRGAKSTQGPDIFPGEYGEPTSYPEILDGDIAMPDYTPAP